MRPGETRRIARAANTDGPALLTLQARGYTIFLELDPNTGLYDRRAEGHGASLVAEAGSTLLGLAALWEIHEVALCGMKRTGFAPRLLTRVASGKALPALHRRVKVKLDRVGCQNCGLDGRALEDAALSLVASRGYALDVYTSDETMSESNHIDEWVGRTSQIEIQADALTLLGLIEMYEHRGPVWRARPDDPDVWDEAYDRTYGVADT